MTTCLPTPTPHFAGGACAPSARTVRSRMGETRLRREAKQHVDAAQRGAQASHILGRPKVWEAGQRLQQPSHTLDRPKVWEREKFTKVHIAKKLCRENCIVYAAFPLPTSWIAPRCGKPVHEHSVHASFPHLGAIQGVGGEISNWQRWRRAARSGPSPRCAKVVFMQHELVQGVCKLVNECSVCGCTLQHARIHLPADVATAADVG